MQQSEKDAERMSPTQTHHLWSIIPIHDTINVSISGRDSAEFLSTRINVHPHFTSRPSPHMMNYPLLGLLSTFRYFCLSRYQLPKLSCKFRISVQMRQKWIKPFGIYSHFLYSFTFIHTYILDDFCEIILKIDIWKSNLWALFLILKSTEKHDCMDGLLRWHEEQIFVREDKFGSNDNLQRGHKIQLRKSDGDRRMCSKYLSLLGCQGTVLYYALKTEYSLIFCKHLKYGF